MLLDTTQLIKTSILEGNEGGNKEKDNYQIFFMCQKEENIFRCIPLYYVC